jgi:hypothetical protein
VKKALISLLEESKNQELKDFAREIKKSGDIDYEIEP